MGDHDSPATCLSSKDHDGAVRDALLHYFGCLRLEKRKAFYDSLDAHYQLRIREELRRIREHRALFEARDDGLVTMLKTSLSSLRQSDSYRNLKRPNPADVAFESSLEAPATRTTNRYGLNANMILFEDSKQYTDRDYPDEFPNQKIPVEELLDKNNGANPLMKSCPRGRIRYFHLPANNMSWVEEAIARHYREEVPQYDGIFRRPEHPSKTYMMLRPEYWRGQQHGGRKEAVHARHMRPRCDIISTDPDSFEESPKNLVLFMPYLHWETDRRRSKFDEIIRNLTEQYKEKEDRRLAKERSQIPVAAPESSVGRTALLESKPEEEKSFWSFLKRKKDTEFQTDESVPKSYKQSRTLTEVIDAKIKQTKRPLAPKKAEKKKGSRMIMPCTVLGQVLLRAAILSEAMEYHFDQELLREYLHRTPPLHPRRTLDQAYYWTLKTTKKRDRDQVVYRGTAPQKEFMHHHKCDKKNKEDCDHRHCGWKHLEKKSPCDQCQRDIRKVPRVVMVDQLWLWILDANTIITCFPKRWGRNKPDPSAVHKSLRLRLKVARKDEIRSVYDLALIIIDQCSRVFFDRTKTADRQPPVMDLFANAIGNIANKQTVAYEHFWHYTQEASKIYRSKDAVETSSMAKALLDINPEGKLVREIKDILDELNIMIQIKKYQGRVLAEFMKHANHISEALQKEALQREEHRRKESREEEYRKVWNQDSSSGPRDLPKEHEAHVEERRADFWRKEYARDMETGVKDRISDLTNLKESAENAEKALQGLLGLKQQQAGVVQAREAVRQAEETLRQGRSIMLFTIITIIFLPLSFFTGVYGMNNAEFNNSNDSIYTQLSYMLPISAGVIVLSFVLAFSSFVRASLAFIFSVTWTWFVTSTRIYELWIDFKTDSQTLTKSRKEIVRLMKEKAVKEKQARHEAKEIRKEAEMRKQEAEGAQPTIRTAQKHLEAKEPKKRVRHSEQLLV